MISEIRQQGEILQPYPDNLLEHKFSENISIHVVFDNKYDGWSVKWDAINDVDKARIPVTYDTKTQCITLSKECFKGRQLYIACAFIKGNIVKNSSMLQLEIPCSVNHGLNNNSSIPNLFDEMRELFQQIIDNEYREPMNDLIDRCDNAIVEVRVTSEEIKTNEQARVVAESNRQAQERVRVNEEKGRQTNETVRNSSESNRLSNENARKEAESNRVTAENARVTAETKRQTDTSAVIERATTAAERCEEFVEELDGKVNVSDVDSELSATSTNPIQNKAVYEALQNIDVSGGGGDTLPIGIIVPYASDTAPDGWLLCDGSSIMRRDYPELFDVIGESYGAGDGVTTFALPNEPNPLAYTKSNNAIQFLERSPELYMIIKAKQSTPLEGNVVNSLESNSETDAPSIKAVNDMLKTLYPVGTILEFDREMDMTSIYGGTWELFGVGRSTICINTNDTDFNSRLKTGGSKTHTMTLAEMPAHNHVASTGVAKVMGSSIRVCKGTYTADSVENKANNHAPATPNTVTNHRDATVNSSDIPGGNHHHDIAVGNTGSGSPMNIMNPYIVVYRYRKTAN